MTTFERHVKPPLGCNGITETLPDLVWETDKDLTYSYVNARSRELLGYDPSEMVGRSVLDFLDPEESKRVADLMASLSAAAAPFQLLEKTMRRKDGTFIVVQSSGLPRNDLGGNLLGYQGIDRDVTIRWQAEKKLRDNLTARLRAMISKTAAAKSLVEHARQLEQINEELHRRNQQLDELRYMSSHDLQEPLRHLLIFSQRLEQHLNEGLSEKVIADVETIKRSASRMRRTILDVQELSSIEREPLDLQMVSVDRCVRQALVLLDTSIRESGAAVSVAEMPSLLADESLIVTLFRHLLGNALKFSTLPATISVSAERADDAWIFGVMDQGPGIDPQATDRIFRPFERIGPQRNDGSSGMGLAICRAIVERHGGKIWVEPGRDRGAHLRFELAGDKLGINQHSS